ncbi:EI24 domain-containing protein [Solirhodobacter olei]|uniref:EI24 domain-containing protein n=1 Tax=Solirhodobacter olei TaxID=2493082 RepID=UPI000FDB29BF|nr:EI24 domain-containing protein [Solirhodobacter olei]
MIAGDLWKALAQFGDRRFQWVLWRGIGLTLILFAALTVLAVWGVDRLVPGHLTLPVFGAVGGVHWLAGGMAALGVLLLSGFLMVPVAALFTGLFLDEVAEAVEARHYPGLPPARPQGLGELAGEGLRLAGLSLVVNLLALVFYLLSGPFAPFLFWAVNGFLLGREYAQGAAARRLAGREARAMVRANIGQVWLLGTLLAVPLTIPLVNLAVPVLAAAAFSHLTVRLPAPSRRPSSGRG